MARSVDVVVIGGGFAGITAARDLQKRGYDVLVLIELHNTQNNGNFSSELWIPSDQSKLDKDGKCTADRAAGVAILLLKRMRRHIDRSGHAGSRIAWVRLKGPICPISKLQLSSSKISQRVPINRSYVGGPKVLRRRS